MTWELLFEQCEVPVKYVEEVSDTIEIFMLATDRTREAILSGVPKKFHPSLIKTAKSYQEVITNS